MNKIPKLQTAWSPLVRQDNTRVERPQIIQPIKRATSTGPISPETMEQLRRNHESYTISQDNRSSHQRQRDQKLAAENRVRQESAQKQEKIDEGWENLMSLTYPSTYIETFTGKLGDVEKQATDMAVFGLAGMVRGAARGLTRTLSKPVRQLSRIGAGHMPTTPAVVQQAQSTVYITDPRKGNALDLHLSRLNTGGYQRLARQQAEYGNPVYYGPIRVTSGSYNPTIEALSDAAGWPVDYDTSKLFRAAADQAKGAMGARPTSMYAGELRIHPESLANAGFGRQTFPAVMSHELDHIVHMPATPPEGFDLARMSRYMTDNNGTELAARGSQIKDWLGFWNDGQKITARDLLKASSRYESDTNIRNHMDEFFAGITDWEKAARWLSDNSTAVSVPLVAGATAYGVSKKAKGGRIKRINKYGRMG